MRHRRSSLLLQAVLLIVLLIQTSGCAVNPYTKRWQFVAVPKSYENSMGTQAYAQVLNDPKIKISNDPREVLPVKRVADRIIEVAKQSKYAETANAFEWDVSVIKDDETKNAFALPGGKMAVYTGIFPIARNEAGLAAIMGHEVVHALARHGAERMSQGLATQVAMIGAAIGLGASGIDAFSGQAAMGALGLGAQVGVLLPFSRKHESEADYIGLLFAAQAGYDPQEAVRVWQRMQAAGGEQPSEYFSTHPGHETRIKQMQEWMPEAMALYQQAQPAPVSNLPGVVGF
jgi:predicted Zn-dependent protease